MNMTHEYALQLAEDYYTLSQPHDMEAAIRAYLDARGLVMVPKEPTAGQMAAGVIQDATIDKYSAMLAAAPDPFADADSTHPST